MRRGIVRHSAPLRAWLTALTLAVCLGLFAGPATVIARGESRTLSIYNVHTKETVTVTYKQDGVYEPEAMRKLNHIMRDWRRDEPTEMDPELIDLIWQIHTELGSRVPVHLVSGYRSRGTNEALRRRGGGQARNSQHIQGKAADIFLPDVDVESLRYSALIHEVGGVGYYPKSHTPFVHVDTARVRAWPRVPRQELAQLFPDGHSQHVPADGRPLTPEDGRKAMAKLKARGEAPFRTALIAKRAERVEVASASGETAEQIPELPLAKPVMASFTPTKVVSAIGETVRRAGDFGFGWLTRLEDQAKPRAMALGTPARQQLASADATVTASLGPEPAPPPPEPTLERAEVVTPAADIDHEHPEELSYQPYSVLPLLADAAAARSHELSGLAHPELEDIGLRLPEPVADPPFQTVQGSDIFMGLQRFSATGIGARFASASASPPPTAATQLALR